MNSFQEKFQRRIQQTTLDFSRSLMDDIAWEARLIGIKGARGVGKTTLLLQYIKKNLPINDETLFVSLDDIWFAEHTLSELVDEFIKKGGKYLFLDEVHKHPNWTQELKNIYDNYVHLKIVFTSSSLLEILNARADLSRRAVVYKLQGLSYREYLNLVTGKKFSSYTLNEILTNHTAIAQEINSEIRPLQYFNAYLANGYYPFFKEGVSLYQLRLEEVINLIIEVELPQLRKIEVAYINKIKQLLHIIAQSVPFMPNISKLSTRIKINRNTLVSYLYFLQEAHIIKNLYKDAKGITQLQKPDKIFLENTNLQYVFSNENADKGNIRETFFVNQISYKHLTEYTNQGDFVVDRSYTFEVGGSNKTNKQIEHITNAFVVADDLEYGFTNKIPLWLFGFLY
jgi:predicted AAA+ superfamily ATPase